VAEVGPLQTYAGTRIACRLWWPWLALDPSSVSR
jgi:hypothetical protein